MDLAITVNRDCSDARGTPDVVCSMRVSSWETLISCTGIRFGQLELQLQQAREELVTFYRQCSKHSTVIK